MPSRPIVKLPAAMLRIWPAPREIDSTLLVATPGIVELSEGTFAVLPGDTGMSVYDSAAYWGLELLRHLALGKLETDGRDAELSVLIFPCEVLVDGESVEPVPDFLMQDLGVRGPESLKGGLFLSGYAATWLRARFELEKAEAFRGPSGRQVPIYRLIREKPEAPPWHNPELLGRRIAIARPEITAALKGVAGDPHGFRVYGAVGTGKTHAVWHFLAERREPTVWIDVGRSLPGATPGRSLPGAATLARQLISRTNRLVDSICIDDRAVDGEPHEVASALTGGLRQAADRLGARPRVVCDGLQAMTATDRDLLMHLLAEPRSAEACRWVLIDRSAPEWPDAAGAPARRMPEVEIPIMGNDELDDIRRQMLAGLEMSEEVTASWLDLAAGNPLALEEILESLVHHGHIRRVYGSYFFDGGDDTTYRPSPRWTGLVEAEVCRLGEPLPLRILAVSELVVPAEQLALGAASLGVEVEDGWQNPYTASGLTTDSQSMLGHGLAFAAPVFGRAVRATLPKDSAVALRHALGQVMASSSSSPTNDWHTYRLLAGSPEALTPLLEYSRSGVDHPTRGELFQVLLSELHEHQQRGGDADSELELLWTLLPMGHRVGRLRELGQELERALELAANDSRRRVAFLTLQAELDQEEGRFKQAENHLREALMVSDGIDEKRRTAIFIRLGELLIRDQSLEEARELFEKLLAVVEAREPVIAATCHYHLGNVALHQKRLQEALDHHRQACDIRRDRGLLKTLGASLSALGSVQLTLGDFPRALDFYREAEEVLNRHGGGEVTLAQRGVGRALGLLGDHMAASKYLRRALEGHRGRDLIGEAVVRLDLAANQLELGHIDVALEDVRQAHFQLSLAPESSQLGDAERLLGRVMVRQDDPLAGNHFAEARRLHLRHDDPSAAAIDVSLLLDLAIAKGDVDAARTRFEELESLIDTSRPLFAEMLYFRLYKAAEWLEHQGSQAGDPEDYLRRAFQDLVRKTDFLTPEFRHGFLFQIAEHRELVNAATRNNLTFPGA